MKKKNLLLFLLLSICFVFGLKCNVNAERYWGAGYTLTYSIGDSAISITGCTTTGSSVSVYIPQTIGNIPVTTIQNQAFLSCSSVAHIIIPDGVTEIGNRAFYNCTGLKSITIPDSVTYIGQVPFANCTSLTSITIPKNMLYVSDYAFYGCTALKTVTIPDGVFYIGDHTFYGCTALSSISIPNSVTTICDYAFNSCSSLSSVTIPSSVTSIGKYAFGYKDTTPMSDGFTIDGTYGSQAAQYAKDNNITFTDKSHTTHTYGAWTTTKAATCTTAGIQTKTCSVCGATETQTIPANGVHNYGAWVVTQPATVFATGVQTHTCTVCGAAETAAISKLTPSIQLSKTKVTLKRNNKKKKSAVITAKAANGDYIVSWKSSKKKVATVNAHGKIVAKKKGKANITVTLASGLTAVVKVTVK